MEIWNPRTKTGELLWVEIPPEQGEKYGCESSVLVTIKGGREFIFYGGRCGSINNGIWKYIVTGNSWTRYLFI